MASEVMTAARDMEVEAAVKLYHKLRIVKRSQDTLTQKLKQARRDEEQDTVALQSAKQIEASITQQKLVNEQRAKHFPTTSGGRRKESAKQVEKLAELKSKIQDVENQRALVVIELKATQYQHAAAHETLLQVKEQQRTLSVMRSSK